MVRTERQHPCVQYNSQVYQKWRKQNTLKSVDHGIWMLPHSEKADLLKWRHNYGRSRAKTTHAKTALKLLMSGEATIKREGKMVGQNMRWQFLYVIVCYIIHPGHTKQRRFCSLLAVFRDESPNIPVPHCRNDQYQFEWAAEARPLCLDRNDGVSDSGLIRCWNTQIDQQVCWLF